MTTSPTFTAAGMLRAAIQQIEDRRINGEEADDFYDEIENFEAIYDSSNAEERALLKEAKEQLKLHGFRLTSDGRTLQYNLWKDTFLPKPDRTPDGEITNAAVVAWYDVFTQGKEMDDDAAWLFTQWNVTLADAHYNQRYVALWNKAHEVLQWDLEEGEHMPEEHYSHCEEVGVNGGSSHW